MPVYTDSEEKKFNCEPGDYIIRCVGFDQGFSKGAKTAGCTQWEFGFLIEGKGVELSEYFIDSEKTLWKLELYLRACGIKIKKGEAYEFSAQAAKDNNCRHIEPEGLRCWATVGMKEVTEKDRDYAVANMPKEKMADSAARDKVRAECKPRWNKIVTFLTDRGILERYIAPVETSPEPEGDDPF